MKLPIRFLTVIILPLALTACSKSQQYQGSDSVGMLSELEARALPLKVTDTRGQPVAGAQVLIGQSLNQPFASNFLITDSQGNFQAPTGWNSAQVVTVGAKGFVRASYFAQKPRGQVFQIRAQTPAIQQELKGQGTGFTVKDNDNLVDFALMIPAVKKADLFSFNIGMFISPQVDIITVYGQKLPIPSNVALPKQKEKYGLFPVTIEKPVYRMYFDYLGKHKVATLRGQFPFKQVVAEMQNQKPFFELINYFSVMSGSLKEIEITQPSQTQDLPVNEITFNSPRSFKSPTFADDEFLLAVALDPVQDKFMPTDFKNVPSNVDFKLNTIQGSNAQLLVALKKKAEQNSLNGGKISAAFVPFKNRAAPQLLPMIESPHVVHATEFRVEVPQAPAGISPVATYSVLSSVVRSGEGSQSQELTTNFWEVYAEGWQAEMKLPEWPESNLPEGLKRWEVSLVGNQGKQKAIDLSPRILETVTHATHSASDF